MATILATAWRPRGELARFRKLLPRLLEVYAGIVVSLPPDTPAEIPPALESIARVRPVVTPEWPWGRYLAVQTALEWDLAAFATHIQYADCDRLLRWAETRLAEWRATVAAIEGTDCLVIGRTPAAYATHPEALVQTERISNAVVSFLLGQDMDVSAGSKGFSRAAAAHLVAACRPGFALGTDGEWPVVLQQAGFKVDYLAVEGLDWESADRYQDEAAGPDRQRQAAAEYDADPANWASRVQVALEIVHRGLDAARRKNGIIGVKE